ncbi:hypothetical protein Q1695_011442 [Nippostrongylus brasiliensis]|nr:hypothetical protein Q1695_011442 [Nippostrongylus brasiliensis]
MGGATARTERVTFHYPPLPEFKLYLAAVSSAIVYGFYCIYTVSRDYEWTMGDHGVLETLPLIGPVMKDVSSWEWANYSPFMWQYLTVFVGHTVVFNVGSKLLPEFWFTILYTLVSIAACAYYFTPHLVAISLCQGAFTFGATHFYRHKSTIWISSLPLLYYMMHMSTMLSENPFFIFTFVSYSMLSYISYCMDTLKGPVRAEDNTVAKSFLRMLFYTFYQPYLFSLIVLYADFERQLAERKHRNRDWKGALFYAIRIAFWWVMIELALHFFYYEVILARVEYAATLPKDKFFALGLCLGIFFHLKYVVIFGIPTAFARFDNMDPQPGPICISRVMLFSKIWREFDRGLYQFFKQYIFVPICAPTFSLPRKVFGVIVSYSFVLLWHGFYHHNIVWIALNIAALFMEMTAKSLYAIESLRRWREKNISDVAFRRILGPLQVVPFAFGLYSNIYFLGGSETGASFVKRIFDEETIPLRWPGAFLLSLGVCYAQVSMEVERLTGEAERKNGKQKLGKKSE